MAFLSSLYNSRAHIQVCTRSLTGSFQRKLHHLHNKQPQCTVQDSQPSYMPPSAQDSSKLWDNIVRSYNRAQDSGAASKMDTSIECLETSNPSVTFILRITASLRDKPKPPKDGKVGKPDNDPFLPYDEALWVQHLSPSHTLLLNKFNVVEHHVLVVTREFEQQTEPLNVQDLTATWQTMQAFPKGALAYFNCGPESGASQPHKHIQIVPLPLADEALQPPFDDILDRTWQEVACKDEQPCSVHQLPYQNYFCKVSPESGANTILSIYQALLLAASPKGVAPQSYNVILSKQYMVLVPRQQERIDAIAVNALAFAGTILISSKAGLQDVKDKGPFAVLAATGCPW